jgi:hypothetical protein
MRPSSVKRTMRGVVLLLAVAAMMAACASPAPTPSDSATPSSPSAPAPTATPTPTSTPAPSLAVVCGDLTAADCRVGARAALAAVAGQATVPIRVELHTGIFCPDPAALFLLTTCPQGALPPPGGGTWLGAHALVSFLGTLSQGYLDLAKDASGVRAVLIAIATPPPSPSPS